MDKREFREIQKKLRLTNEGVSEAIDVELFTVQNWATGAWPIPKAIVKFLRTLVLLSEKVSTFDAYTREREAGYDAARLNRAKGYTDGYKEGQAGGYARGCSEGYSKGSNDGFTAGKQIGYTYGLEDSTDARKKECTEGYDEGQRRDRDGQSDTYVQSLQSTFRPNP